MDMTSGPLSDTRSHRRRGGGIIRPVEEALSVDKVKWGWAPFWAKGKRPDPINARVETVITGEFFSQIWPKGRVPASANGWFEWVKDEEDPKKKQPCFITLKEQIPMFFAGLAEMHEDMGPNDRDGFVIITAASAEGMVDNHDRKPLVLSPEHARECVNGSIPTLPLNELANSQWSTAGLLRIFHW